MTLALAQAYLIHNLPGRVRLRIASRKNQTDYFQSVCAAFQACAGVEQCRFKADTGSLLIQYTPGITSWGFIREFAEAHDLFACSDIDPEALAAELKKAAQPLPSVAELAGQGLGFIDGTLSSVSKGLLDLQSFYILAHVGLGIRELTRGHIMSPAYTLIWRSLELAGKKK
jgi:hypothetical protein